MSFQNFEIAIELIEMLRGREADEVFFCFRAAAS
jgi:hypothetical protein